MNDYRKAVKIIRKLQRRGYQSVLAGGAPRDMLLGKEPHDYDICTDATPSQVEKIFRQTKAVGKSFGVVLVKIKDVDFEVASFRRDGIYSDGRHPDSIEFTSMEEDAKRRDFTVNAMFYDPRKKKYIDFFNGQKDLQARRIRFVGDPIQRITEDNLRLIRAIRFAVKLDSWIEPESMKAIRENASKIANVASERINEELMKMLALGQPRKMLELLFDSGLLTYIMPEVIPLRDCPQNPKWHPEGRVWIHTIMVMEGLTQEKPILQLAALLHDIGKPATTDPNDPQLSAKGHDELGAKMAVEIMTRLKFSNDEISYVRDIISDHMKMHLLKEMKKSTLKRYMALPHFEDLIKLGRADVAAASKDFSNFDCLKEKTQDWKPEEIKPKGLVTGDDLIAKGLKPGPQFKELLTMVMDAQLEGTIKTKDEGLKLVQKVIDARTK